MPARFIDGFDRYIDGIPEVPPIPTGSWSLALVPGGAFSADLLTLCQAITRSTSPVRVVSADEGFLQIATEDGKVWRLGLMSTTTP